MINSHKWNDAPMPRDTLDWVNNVSLIFKSPKGFNLWVHGGATKITDLEIED